MKNHTNTHAIFSSIAEKYDRLNGILSFHIDKLWRRKTLKLIEPALNVKILDLCCGTGEMLLGLGNRLGKNAEIVGLDFNEKMLDIAKIKLVKGLDHLNIKLVHGNALSIPFEDESFNFITIAFGIRNLPDTHLSLIEMHRVLKPGGKLIILELSNPETPVLRGLYSVYLTKVLPLIGYLGTGDRIAYQYLRDSVKRFFTKKELQKVIQAAGFQDTGYIPLTGGIAAIHFGKR